MPFGKKWNWHSGDGKQAQKPKSNNAWPSLQYQTLGINEIRLVQLLPGSEDTVVKLIFLPNASIDALPPYHALSYTWGDQAKTHIISIDGIPVRITRNLAEFLEQHRQDLFEKLGTLWIDALCINQTDNDEKNAQLPLMRQVYEKAYSTIVWLGPQTNECKKGLHLMNTLPRSSIMLEDANGRLDLNPWLEIEANRALVKDCWLSFAHLTSLPWFSRIWVKQEYIVSSEIEIQYGKRHFSLLNLYPAGIWLNLASRFQDIILEIAAEHPEERWRMRHSVISINNIESLARSRERRLKYQSKYPILHFLWTLRDNKATDPRDKVYALLGLLGAPKANISLHTSAELGYDSNMLVVDYNAKIEDVYKSVVKAVVVATKKLNIIAAAQPDGLSGSPTMSHLPSWAPDWSRPWEGQSLLLHKIKYQSSGVLGGDFMASKFSEAVAHFSDDLRFLRVKGVVVDSVDDIWGPLTKHIDGFDMMEPNLAFNYRKKAQRWRETRSLEVYGTSAASDRALWDSLTLMLGEDGIQGKGKSFETWSFPFLNWLENTRIDATMMAGFVGTMRGRRTMVSKKGYVFAGPKNALAAIFKGFVCVLLGCDVPVILRSHHGGKYFEFIGECYCPGIMKGEIMNAVDAGTAEIVDFELH